MPEHRSPPGPPPTIAGLQAMGVTGIVVSCAKCKRNGALSFEKLGVDGGVAFPMIAHMRLVCGCCGEPGPIVMPDWTGYRPSGSGGH